MSEAAKVRNGGQKKEDPIKATIASGDVKLVDKLSFSRVQSVKDLLRIFWAKAREQRIGLGSRGSLHRQKAGPKMPI